ncbi:MAG: LegC family aminotransferase [Roseateles asaccharophilus]|uniref:GDP-perosamine synthase n=1 Tax=Roseateles asaccharophilus TaxID=582607 RepID=A0A4R6MZ06_9BURK|nr:LegC family aminotransferase [Roseateles asaccharophilus]MDN3545719.1 LegC family aminotransferase [Roseateles asaccharophilus]TDP07587.1 perosamine synthetase [Roseateles asaccharophilus]
MSIAPTVLDRIQRVTQAPKVALHEPTFGGNELKYVTECIQTGWVSSVGEYVNRFERELAAYTGAAHAVVVSNGTSGLQVTLELVGVRRDDEVLVPALSFVATANAVRHCGAWPHFVDSDVCTLGIDVAKLEAYLRDIAEQRNDGCYNRRTGRRIAAVVPMHTFGHPVDMPALVELAERHRLEIVEDAAESLGSWIGDRHTGTFGRCAMLSFNGNKIVTTGGGGAIITNDGALAKRAKHVTTTAKQPHPWAFFHDEVAYNFRMPNLNAAMGCAQLERIGQFLEAKRLLASRYVDAFRDVPEVSMFLERPGTQANYWLQTLLLAPEVAAQRDEILATTNAAGQMTRPVWELLYTLPMYSSCERMATPVADDLAQRVVNLPSSPQLMPGVV